MMKKIFFAVTTLLMILCIDFLNAENNINQIMQNDGSILLPAQSSKNMELTTNAVNNKDFWNDFTQKNPSWKIFFNGITGKPHRAFGKPVQIEGYSSINSDNVQSAALAFLKQNKPLFSVDADNLKLRKSLEINNLWTLSFTQMYKGIEVLLTEVELRIRKDGKVMAFGINTYDNINLEIVPSVSQHQAESIAAMGLQFDEKKDRLQSNSSLYILPVKSGKNVSFGLVKEIIVDMPSTNQKFSSYVDMHNANILWRRSLIANVETPITVKAGIKLNSRLSPITEENLGNFNLTVDGMDYSTDANGNVSVDIDDTSDISAYITGKWVRVAYDGQTLARFSGTVNPGESFAMLWTDINSHRFERDLYYYTNHAHDYYKQIDPSSNAMDFQLNVTIFNYSTPNAGSDLETGDIYFFGVTQTSMYVVETPSVLYHEYGHSINTRLYKELGISQGMINGACHEAMADVNACLMIDNPKVGYLAFSDTNRSIRNLVNTKKYPKDLNVDPHATGLILAGAYWDLRKVTDLDYMRWLVHYTKKMGTPDDENTGIAFFEWFIETLITDDNYGDGDNDLSNGSPYALQIIESFNKHNIGTWLAMLMSFEHNPYEDTQDTENPYRIEFKVRNPATFLNYEPQNVKLLYLIDGLELENEVSATFLGNDSYEAFIPAMPKGTIVDYYMSATDKQTNQNMKFSRDNLKLKPFEFLVGYKTGFEDNIESQSGWTLNVFGDGATGGLWEIGVPQLVAFSSSTGQIIMQPGSDHSDIGNKCLVTGASNGGGTQQGILANMPNGKTSVITPTYNLLSSEKPIFTFYKFFSNMPYLGGYPALFKIYFSSNDGANWVVADSTTTPTDGWEKFVLQIESYIAKTDKFKVKFEFTGYFYQGIPMYLAEGLVDDIVILTANDDANITAVEDIEPNSSITVYPNPFSDFIDIRLSNSSKVTEINIYDILGNKINTIRSNNGNTFQWDATGFDGNPVERGIYFIRIFDGVQYLTEKIILK